VFSTFDEVMEAVARRHVQFRNVEPGKSTVQTEQISLGLAEAEISKGRALVVDVDGVLADTQSVAEASLRTTASTLGASMDDARWADLRTLTPYALATDLGLRWRGFNEAFTARLLVALAERDFIRPEVRDVLLRARARGWRLAAVTSQPRSRAMATLKASASLFEVLITYNDTVRRTKPDPYPLLLAAERLGVSVQDAVAVGDTHVDLLAARRAKMRSVAVLWGYEGEAELSRYSPDHVVASPAELEDLLTRELEPVG
jgi:HAD superfamily hydrolase (TIGR01509 family)